MSEVRYLSMKDFPAEVPDQDLFYHNRRTLLKDKKFPCAAPECDSLQHDLEVYHIANWCGYEHYDYNKLRQFLKIIDPYGFSREIEGPIESIHDLRNLIVLCRRCHRERPYAISKVPFPEFVMQAVAKKGIMFEPQYHGRP